MQKIKKNKERINIKKQIVKSFTGSHHAVYVKEPLTSK